MRIPSLILVVALFGCACETAHEAPRTMPIPPKSTAATPTSWEAKLGQVVTVEGVAEDAKLGAVLTMGADIIWIDGLEAWPKELRERRVSVTGRVIQRADLPVFVHREGAPEEQGMPVPPGTDV
jgi:hypothetical protein